MATRAVGCLGGSSLAPHGQSGHPTMPATSVDPSGDLARYRQSRKLSQVVSLAGIRDSMVNDHSSRKPPEVHGVDEVPGLRTRLVCAIVFAA